MTEKTTEKEACLPVPVDSSRFNVGTILPYGLKAEHIEQAMADFIEFLGLVNRQVFRRGIQRLERFMMPANFSSLVGEFVKMAIPKYCPTLVSNRYHNGHPDLIPSGHFPMDAVQHGSDGIEIKGSRYDRGWQGHNPENVWLMVFTFDNNTASRPEALAIRFRFKGVYASKLDQDDWKYAGRSSGSRRTITSSVNKAGYNKMRANWVYLDSGKR